MKRALLFITVLLLAATSFVAPALAQNASDIRYYTDNGIIFYEGGALHCDSGASGAVALTGGAASMLQAQKTLDPKWVPIILAAAQKANADPIAMASLMFWEHRRFPPYGPNHSNGDSDSIGRGTWQITSSSWPASAGPYQSGVYDPAKATEVAAQIVVGKGGRAGLPLGSIEDSFPKNGKVTSIAGVAKGYNAGNATWRNPASASWGQSGREWENGTRGAWFSAKQKIIDDYIVGVTYAYYAIGSGIQLPNSFNNDDFVQTALKKQDAIKAFKIGGGGNSASGTAQTCASDIDSAAGGTVVQTARTLAWPNQKHKNDKNKSDATPAYQSAMPKAEGGDPGNDSWSDCGVFVATVMRTSGADPKYARRSTNVQYDYIKSSGKYNVYPNLTKASQLKAGDIMIIPDEHTYIYTGTYKGDDGKTYTAAGASWHDHVPIANFLYFDQGSGHFAAAHLKSDGGPRPGVKPQ